MSKRSILFPAAAAMSLWLTACRDPIVGDWELRFLDGERWPISGSEEGCSYRVSIMLEVDEDLDVKYIETGSDTCYGDHRYLFRGEVEVETKRKEYEIEIFEVVFDAIFECELEDDELQCDDLEDYARYEFERE